LWNQALRSSQKWMKASVLSLDRWWPCCQHSYHGFIFCSYTRNFFCDFM
jgi:hypothetical protein